MKRLVFVLVLFALGLTACCQKQDQTFDVMIWAKKGIMFGDSTKLLTAPTGSGGTVTWENVLNKPATYPPASHDHNSLYKPIGYVPTWAEITGKPATYAPSSHTHAWGDVTGKPTEIELINELPQLAYLPIPQKTTAEINAMVVPAGTIALVYDKTVGVLKLWNGSIWKTIIANQ